jgi:hypothetical protein
MKLFFETIVLDGMPFLPMIYSELRKLVNIDWQWNCVEGVAAPVGCTKWCAPTAPRLSLDGTTPYLEALSSFDPRVVHWKKELWQGKAAMLNEPLKFLHEPAVLMQVDSDEIWQHTDFANIHTMLAGRGKYNCAMFRCRYFVGPDIVITSRDTYGNNSSYEWLRAWRIDPGARFETHEPPKLKGVEARPFLHEHTEKLGLVFDHFAWATEKQVAEKASYYGSPNNKEHGKDYANAVEGWRRLQEAKMPVENLAAYLPWVGEGVTANRIQP